MPTQPRIISLKDLSPANVAVVAAQAVAVLKAGGTVIYPTETVYGIGVDATNPAAVEKVLNYKARREGKPLSVAITDQAMAEKLVELNDQARSLYQRFLPGPVTVISQSLGQVAPGVASEFGTLGIRMPAHPLIMAMVQQLGRPITATSANASGKKRPYTLNDIFERLSPKQLSLVDLAIDVGELPPNPPSTVIDTTLSTPLVMRQGEMVADEAATVVAEFVSHSAQETRDVAGKWLLKYWEVLKRDGLVIGLNGSLGAGKTVLTQGIGNFLHITDQITSPTYTYILEYPYQRYQQAGVLHHVDAWKIDSAAEAARLELSKLVQPGSVLVIEWWSQVAEFVLAELPESVPVLTIDLAVTGETQRNLTVRVLREGN